MSHPTYEAIPNRLGVEHPTALHGPHPRFSFRLRIVPECNFRVSSSTSRARGHIPSMLSDPPNSWQIRDRSASAQIHAVLNSSSTETFNFTFPRASPASSRSRPAKDTTSSSRATAISMVTSVPKLASNRRNQRSGVKCLSGREDDAGKAGMPGGVGLRMAPSWHLLMLSVRARGCPRRKGVRVATARTLLKCPIHPPALQPKRPLFFLAAPSPPAHSSHTHPANQPRPRSSTLLSCALPPAEPAAVKSPVPPTLSKPPMLES